MTIHVSVESKLIPIKSGMHIDDLQSDIREIASFNTNEHYPNVFILFDGELHLRFDSSDILSNICVRTDSKTVSLDGLPIADHFGENPISFQRVTEWFEGRSLEVTSREGGFGCLNTYTLDGTLGVSLDSEELGTGAVHINTP